MRLETPALTIAPGETVKTVTEPVDIQFRPLWCGVVAGGHKKIASIRVLSLRFGSLEVFAYSPVPLLVMLGLGLTDLPVLRIAERVRVHLRNDGSDPVQLQLFFEGTG